jgi:hypothetical protein
LVRIRRKVAAAIAGHDPVGRIGRDRLHRLIGHLARRVDRGQLSVHDPCRGADFGIGNIQGRHNIGQGHLTQRIVGLPDNHDFCAVGGGQRALWIEDLGLDRRQSCFDRAACLIEDDLITRPEGGGCRVECADFLIGGVSHDAQLLLDEEQIHVVDE